ncbi:hypothetical protein G7B40_030405 [Aetokthonos hydrillicola Thurmond2011]|jgi:hypothetical protein|uniref:Uncharacterized protein n=1 Tax=Aetokthonos hydrillicola Thurmond2011 TaxID=2712845 RepID=A0AAP5IC76_9CYAN|nr:hypothetical protein [Aetokthonos hydrillicola]MBO3457359.1 hypothetical protein [Aetokthonos hydrillicola CCALA 1050]MBW4583965.1 hypothetical protein [Aetokthonos hydrillicola CCALA 1050]MDR9898838.1 hypothetical protein [Aetokthonos hydrillicola Thurmond2011]
MNTSQTVKEISTVEMTNAILVDLQKLSSYSGEPMAAVYVDNLMRTMRIMRDKYTADPLTEVVMALHDALAYSNRWIDYTATQYQGAYDLLASLLTLVSITNLEVESAILTLEDLGFDTLPFGVQLDDNQHGNLDEE